MKLLYPLRFPLYPKRMEDILAIILKNTYSLTQLKHRLRILKSNLLKTIFGNNQDNSAVSPADLNWLQSLPPGLYQQFNKDNVYQIFTNLEEEVAHLQNLIMYLPFEPDDTTINQIGAIARQTFFPALLLDIKFDPNLIAGAVLSWKGIMRDYSLRTQIEARKEEISQGFKKFLR